MKLGLKWTAFAALAVAMTSLSGGRAEAALIIYTETATASGSLNGTTFTDAAVTIAATADTSEVVGGSGFFLVNPDSNSVTISGVGAGSFTSPSFNVFVNQTFTNPSAAAGFTGENGSVLDTFNPAFAAYALDTAFGPAGGSTFINPGVIFATTAGNLILTSVNGDATFSADTPAAVPEPSSFVLAGIAGVVGLAGYRSRRRPGV